MVAHVGLVEIHFIVLVVLAILVQCVKVSALQKNNNFAKLCQQYNTITNGPQQYPQQFLT